MRLLFKAEIATPILNSQKIAKLTSTSLSIDASIAIVQDLHFGLFLPNFGIFTCLWNNDVTIWYSLQRKFN